MQNILGFLLTDKLRSWLKQVNLEEDVNKLISEMESVDMMLEFVKGRKIDNEKLTGSLCNLKDLLYDAGDMLDLLDYYRLEEHITKGAVIPDPRIYLVHNFVCSFFLDNYVKEIQNENFFSE